MSEPRDYAAGAAGLGVGGLVGRGLADSDAANSLLVRWLTRKAPAAGKPDFRVPVYAGADLNLEHGSGEAVMGSRISRMLQRHGIGSYYVNTNWRPNDGDIARGFNLPEGGRDPWWSKDVGNNAKLWSDNTRIDGSNLRNLRKLRTNFGGRQGTAFAEIVSRMGAAGVPRRAVLRLLRSGAFNQFTPGELLDTFKVVGNKGIADIAAGKMQIAPSAVFRDIFQGRRLPYAMTGETGMNYNTLAGNGAAKAVAENTYPYREAPGTRNLSLDTQFQANYRAGGDPLIPGSGMHDPGFGRRSRLARMWKYHAPKVLGGGEKAEYMAAVRRLAQANGIDPKTITPGTKLMLISTGAAGANAAEKLRLAEKAFAQDPNVRVLLQYGKANPASAAKGLDLYTNNGVMEEIARINRARPGFVIPFARDPAYSVLARNVDLHGTYGGSSTITEALANTNPTVTMSDTYLNKGNNNYGTARRGIQQIDSGATAIGRELRGGRGLNDVVNTRDGGQTLRQAIKDFGLGNADYGKIEQEAVQKLRDAMYKSPGKFDAKSVRAANGMLREQTARNRNFVDTVRKLVTKAIDRSDASTYRGMKPGAGRSMARIARALFRTPAGRRVGLPLMLASALGLGGGAFAASRAAHSGGK